MKSCLLVSIFAIFFGASASAANLCNDSVANPLLCKSKDEKYAIMISGNSNVTGIGVSTDSFCTKGYLKLNGAEVNGAFVQPSDDDNSGIDSVDAVSTDLGVRLANPATKKVIIPQTAVGFNLSEKGTSMVGDGINNGHVYIFNDTDLKGTKTGWMYLYSGKTQKAFIAVICE